MYNTCMITECHGTILRKKTYMGDRKMIKAIMDPECETIEDWAFANCSCLKEVYMPVTIQTVSEKAFLNCDVLEQIILYDPADPSLSKVKNAVDPVLLAATLKCFPHDTGALVPYAKDESVFLQHTDSRLANYLAEDDSFGFVPFLAGGEEDYLVDDAADAFRKKRQFLKTQLIYERILVETQGHTIMPELKQTCMEWLRSHNPSAAFKFLLTDTLRRNAYLDLYFALELNNDVDINVLTALSEAQPELKAKIIRKHLETIGNGMNILTGLEI